jgi:steroid delta-isomerase-like uncharacterized protein
VPPSEEIREKREAIVREHVASENRHSYGETIETFDHPRYELIATDDVHDGYEAVKAYFDEIDTGFPDRHDEIISIRHTDDVVFMEFQANGTHLGPYRGLPPTGRKWTCRMLTMFIFEEDRLVCERVYYDSATILRQLGIAHDPLTLRGRIATALNHPVTVGRAVARQVLRR